MPKRPRECCSTIHRRSLYTYIILDYGITKQHNRFVGICVTGLTDISAFSPLTMEPDIDYLIARYK